MVNKVDFEAALRFLDRSGNEFEKVFEHGTLSVELYRPAVIDKQTPHERDEVYIIASGEATFLLEDEAVAVKAGCFLFVPAGDRHKFIDFTIDFTTWVLFYGPGGGERSIVTNYLKDT